MSWPIAHSCRPIAFKTTLKKITVPYAEFGKNFFFKLQKFVFCLKASLLDIFIMAACRNVDQTPKTSASNNARSSTHKSSMANYTTGCLTMMVSVNQTLGHFNHAAFYRFTVFSASLTVDPVSATDQKKKTDG